MISEQTSNLDTEPTPETDEQKGLRPSRLAEGLAELVRNHPSVLVSIIAPTLALALAWRLYRFETAGAAGVELSLDGIVGAMLILACALGFLFGRFLNSDLRPPKLSSLNGLNRSDAAGKPLFPIIKHFTGGRDAAQDEIDQMKSRLVSELGHELRAPVSALVSAAKIIVRHHDTRPEVVDRFGSTIVTEGERLSRLLNDLLDLTRIETDCMEWQESDCHAEELAHEAVASVDALAARTGTHVRTEIDPSVGRINCDADRIHQTMLNFLENAIRYSPAGGEVLLSMTTNERELVVSVSDQGQPLSESEADRIFDRFAPQRGVAAGGSGNGGERREPKMFAPTGLGLCLSREIVERHGGRIWAEGSHSGSLLSFTIPFIRPSLASSGIVEAGEDDKPVRVLTLLESDALSQSAAAIPAETGLECHTFTDLKQLEASVASYRPQAVLISASLIPESTKPLYDALQSAGLGELLVVGPDGRIRSRTLRDSTVIAVRRLRYHATPGDHVLLVEDDERFRQIAEFELRNAGYQVTAAGDGRTALDALRNSTEIDAILLDIMLPEIDGLTILEELAHETRKLPVIVLTGMDGEEVADAAESLGAVEVVRKDGADESRDAPVLARVQRLLGPILSPGAEEDIHA